MAAERFEEKYRQVTVKPAEKLRTRKSSYSTSDTYFDPNQYIRKNCTDYINGVVSSADIGRTNGDPNLTSAQKETAKRELEYQSGMYY